MSSSIKISEVIPMIGQILKDKGGLSVVIPAFNEETAIGDVVCDIFSMLQSSGGPFEVLVVDDCSEDNTGTIAKNSGSKVLRHGQNRGYGAALKTGIRKAKYNLIAIADADGQHDAAQLAAVLLALEEGDVSIGARHNSPSPLLRKPGKFILKWVANWITGCNIPDLNSGLRVMEKEAILECMHLAPDGFSFSTTTTIAFIHGGWLIKWVPIQIHRRQGRPSSVRIVRDGLKTLLLIIRLVVLFAPLRVFLPVSGLFIFLGSLSTMVGLVREKNIADKDVLILLTGIMIFFYGILADQLAAIRREIRK